MSPTPDELQTEIGALTSAVAVIQNALKSDPLPGAVASLNTAVQNLQKQASSEPWFTNPQHGNVSTQLVGNGSLQAFSPSVSGLAFGGNVASATYTAFKMDETGIYLFGKKVGDDPVANLKKDVERQNENLSQIAQATGRLTQLVEYPGSGLISELDALKLLSDRFGKDTVRLVQLVEYPGSGLIAETATLKEKLAHIETTVKELPDRLEHAGKTNLTQGGKRGVASNTAELDAIRKAVEELAEKLGV